MEWFLKIGKSFSEEWVNGQQVFSLRKNENKKKAIESRKIICDHCIKSENVKLKERT